MSQDVAELVPEVPTGLEVGLRNYWYPILQSSELGSTRPVGVRALNEGFVVWRDAHGQPGVLTDRCAHRAARLSVGRILDGDLQCAFHGLRYNARGECVLVPWEADDSPAKNEIHVQSYPTQELGGYIWAYLGDAERFPPPPLEAEVPEELMHPDEFSWFPMPTEIWDANWLLTIDGGDAFHAVTLHAETQAVKTETWKGGEAQKAEVPLADRRVKIVESSYGIRAISTDRNGNPIHHGHLLDVKGDRFVLPCISVNVIQPVPGVEPYTSRLWQFPLDAKRTIIQRFAVQRTPDQEAREKWARLFEDVVGPRLRAISGEDAMIAAAQAGGDLVQARSSEYLFEPDMGMFEVRRCIRDAFVEQLQGRRVAAPRTALVYPV
jgi:nitrite reductase/ring-hydroxylating ferredoxin subunit